MNTKRRGGGKSHRGARGVGGGRRRSGGCAFDLLEPRQLLSGANLDISYGTGGEFDADLGAPVVVSASIQQSDGKTLVAGSLGPVGGTDADAFLARITAGGALDTTFGTGGIAKVNVGAADVFEDLAIRGDGTILAAGNTSDSAYLLVLFSADGKPVTTGFGGGDGIATGSGQIHDIALVGDGLASFFTAGGDVVRKHAASTGGVDGSFGGTGGASVAALTKLDEFKANDLVVRPDGKILVAGLGHDEAPPTDPEAEDYMGWDIPGRGAFLVQLTAGGAADASFDHDAVQAMYVKGDSQMSLQPQLLVSPSGALYASWDEAYHGGQTVVTRYSPADGSVIWQQSSWNHDYLYEAGDPLPLVLDGKGNLLVPRVASGVQVRRFDAAAGTPDLSFGDAGQLAINVSTAASNDPLYGPVILAAEDKLIMAAGDSSGLHVVRTGPNPATDHIGLTSRGTLWIKGSAANDAVTVRVKNGRVRVAVGEFATSFSLSRVKRVYIETFGGEDVIKVYATVTQPTTLIGGMGNDTITGGSGNDLLDETGDTRVSDPLAGGGVGNMLVGGDGNDTLLGATGDDAIYGGRGKDSLSGGDGRDQLDGYLGADILRGGAGEDGVNLEYRTDNLHITLDDVADDGGAGEADNYHSDIEDFRLGSGNDYFSGSDGNNWVSAGAGNDTLYGNGGDDGLHGAADRDRIRGGAGKDILTGSDDADDSDWLYADGDNEIDTLFAGAGDRVTADSIDVRK